jgi:hypothetical protein
VEKTVWLSKSLHDLELTENSFEEEGSECSTRGHGKSPRDRILERSIVSYSLLEPEWPAVCECKYDEARDEMDREDCPFHCNQVDHSAEEETRTLARKKSARTGDVKTPAA